MFRKLHFSLKLQKHIGVFQYIFLFIHITPLLFLFVLYIYIKCFRRILKRKTSSPSSWIFCVRTQSKLQLLSIEYNGKCIIKAVILSLNNYPSRKYFWFPNRTKQFSGSPSRYPYNYFPLSFLFLFYLYFFFLNQSFMLSFSIILQTLIAHPRLINIYIFLYYVCKNFLLDILNCCTYKRNGG